jgi:hypothetical protein
VCLHIFGFSWSGRLMIIMYASRKKYNNMFHFNLFYVLQNQNKQIFKELKQNIKDHSKRWYICKNEKPKIYLKVLIRVQNNKYIKT